MNHGAEAIVEKLHWLGRVSVRRRWLALSVAGVVAVCSGVAITAVSDRYEATARVYVDTQTVLKPLMAGLTFQPDIDVQVRMLARTLISRPNVERLLRLPQLHLHTSSDVAREELVSKLMDQIKVVPSATGNLNLYEISYRGKSPGQAMHLVDATVEMFVHSGSGAKKRDSEDAGRFIENQIRTYETKLVEAESRLKDFKVRNFGVSGVSNQDYFARVSELSEKVNKLRADLGSAEQSRDAYRRELSAEDPQLPEELTAKSGVTPDIEARLALQRRLLDDLRSRFTDAHPDVANARRAVALLEAEARERKVAEERLLQKLGKTGKAATSPVYQKLRISLAEEEARVAALRSELTTQQSRLDQVRSVAGRLPQVEAELAQLNRDYDIIRKNYDLMVARRESALLGVKLDESSQLAEFRVIDPPRVSRSPVFPGRLHLALIAVAASALVGLVAAVLVELLHPTFDQARALRLFSARPVLGSVSLLLTPGRLHAQRVGRLRFGAAVVCMVAVQAGWLAWLVMKPVVE